MSAARPYWVYMVVVHQCKCSSSVILYRSIPLSVFHLSQAPEHANNENHQLVWCVCVWERAREREVWESPGPSPKLSDITQPSHRKELNQDEAHQLTAFKWVIASESLHGLVEEFEREIQECLEETASAHFHCLFLPLSPVLSHGSSSFCENAAEYLSRFPSFTPTCLFCYCNNAVFRQQCH